MILQLGCCYFNPRKSQVHQVPRMQEKIWSLTQGSLHFLFGGIKQGEYMVTLREFLHKSVHCLGWQYNDLCYEANLLWLSFPLHKLYPIQLIWVRTPPFWGTWNVWWKKEWYTDVDWDLRLSHGKKTVTFHSTWANYNERPEQGQPEQVVQQADEDYQDMDSFSTIKGDEMDERRPSMVEELQAWNSWLKPLVQKQNCRLCVVGYVQVARLWVGGWCTPRSDSLHGAHVLNEGARRAPRRNLVRAWCFRALLWEKLLRQLIFCEYI